LRDVTQSIKGLGLQNPQSFEDRICFCLQVGRNRLRKSFDGPLSKKSVREQSLAGPPEWVTTLPFPPEEGGRSSLLNVEEILASEMDMFSPSVTSITTKHCCSKYLSLKNRFTHEKMDSTANPLKLLARYGDSWAEDGSNSGFLFGGIFW